MRNWHGHCIGNVSRHYRMYSLYSMKRSLSLLGSLALVFTSAIGVSAHAADIAYPTRTVRMVVPFPPGGAADVFARIIGEKLSHSLDQSVVVDNRPGAGGIVATEGVARSEPDGHTLLLVTVGHAVNPSLYSKLSYDTLADFKPVAMIDTLPSVLGVNAGVPATSLAELLEMARARPEALTYASAGNASTSHMAVAQLSSMAQVKLMHVPYKRAPPALTDTDVVGRHVDMIIAPIVSTTPFVAKGELRPLAVTTAQRSHLLPDVPTMSEAGVPGYAFSAWFMVIAPTGTPDAIIDRLNADIAAIQDSEEVKQRYLALGAEPAKASRGEMNDFLRAEVSRYADIVRDNNIRVE
jgi:tripartite-type tricarboxylate transporter receptor subunit TctC